MVFAHVAFDLDGTLVDSRADIAASANHVLAALGRAPLPMPVVQGYIGDGARALVERALGPGSEALVPEALERFLAHYETHLLDRTRVYPGVAATLAALRDRGVALSVLTNKPAGMSRAIVDGIGLGAYFVAVVGGDSLPTRKPDPAGVEHLRALTGTPHGRMLLVGDSAIDVRTARAAGIACCGVAWGFGGAGLRAAAPDQMIEHPAELFAVVGVESG